MFSLALFLVLMLLFFFSILFSITITSLGDDGAGLYVSHASVCLFCIHNSVSYLSSSWCHRASVACDCGTTWTFHLSHVMRLWYFSSSVNSFFKRACVAIQWD